MTVSNSVVTWQNGLNFLDRKYGTVSRKSYNKKLTTSVKNYVNKFMTWCNGLKFCCRKFWDRFDFCPDLVKQSQNFVAAKYATVSFFVVMWLNSLKFCSREIWDRFNFCPIMCKTVY